ncbi:hypothetical protein [Mycobacterium sp.]|uniref:hypothetical protein n=1 Tax=Mycobacterium sp. TaxID=1785 RepID=UPI001282C32D|nr:hypothetical protein [Mycobacterium sp.]KAA8964980.1 MAG: hypothetical protein F6Q13_08880 [Mycobacterium sp.]
MSGQLVSALIAAAVVALGVSGCSKGALSAAASPPPAPAAAPIAPVAPAPPPPEVLTDVLYRLADPAVPGTAKLSLIEGATLDNAAVLDRFATALRDGGYAPMTFTARDVAWSDRHPAHAVATVDVSTPNPAVSTFTFPMEFKAHHGGWQLSQQTAELLLAFPAGPPVR